MTAFRMVAFATLLTLLALPQTTNGQVSRLNANDVSWLFPVPDTPEKLERSISMGDLKRSDGTDVWSDRHFRNLLDVVENGATEVGGHEVEFETAFSDKSNWRIAGMRVDPTAPGAHEALIKRFGSSVQIRLIVQPVTTQDGEIEIHDTAVHLVYSFILETEDAAPGTPKVPDNEKLKAILRDLCWLKALSEAGGVETDEVLGVHPGLEKDVPGLRKQLMLFLGRHLAAEKLDNMAVMGIESGVEPWIFLALNKLPSGDFGPIPLNLPFAKPQMIDFLNSPGEVTPKPVVANVFSRDGQLKGGVATDVLFGIASSDIRDFATIGTNDDGSVIKDDVIRNTDVADIVANPAMSNFFNTDCVSCHTESQRRESLGLPLGAFAFRVDGVSPRRSPSVMSAAQWNVRNFGWFPDFFESGATSPTATQRTANETAEVLEFIKKHFADCF